MKVALVGLGRTGKLVAEYLLEQNALVMVLCRKNTTYVGIDLGDVLQRKETGIVIDTCERLEETLFNKKPDVLIDFSSANFLRENIHILSRCGINVVTAVTGYETADIEKFKRVAKQGRMGLIMAPNITYGVNVMMLMAEIAAKLMSDYDFEIVEEHHNRKKDKPSGTAKKIVDKIDSVLMSNSDSNRETPIHSIRSGGIVGKHKVIICSEYDKIEITHESYSRKAFAAGAYRAAQFIYGRTGYYEMDSVFTEEQNKRQQIVHESSVTNNEHICSFLI